MVNSCKLPRRFFYTGNFTIACQLSKTNAANAKKPHKAVPSATKFTTVVYACRELGFLPQSFAPQVLRQVRPLFIK
jgi:hypothetical protein